MIDLKGGRVRWNRYGGGWQAPVAAAVGAVLSPAGPLSAEIIRVPQDYPTIQAGIDAASRGDEVVIADGVYTGPGNRDIRVGAKLITIGSENGPKNCIVDCEGLGRGFDFSGGTTRKTVLRGLTIRGGNARQDLPGGGAIRCVEAGPTIVDCIVTANSGVYGAGIFCEAASPLIQRCRFVDNDGMNDSYSRGSGMHCRSGSSPTVTGCYFRGNVAAAGGALYCVDAGSNPVVEACTFEDNRAQSLSGGTAGAIFVSLDTHPTISACRFARNAARAGGSIGITLAESDERLTVQDSIFVDHETSLAGAAIHGWAAEVNLIRCIFDGNNSGTDGGAVNLETGTVRIEDCTFARNESRRGGALHIVRAAVTITGTQFLLNGASDMGGAIYLLDCDAPIQNSLFADNRAKYGAALYHASAGPRATVTNSTIVTNVSESGAALRFSGNLATVRNSIVRRNRPGQISDGGDVTFSDVEGGWPGEGNIDADPLFVAGPLGSYYLSQVASGQPFDSPCVDAGSDTARNLGLDVYTTRTDQVGDAGIVDMGLHYPRLVGGVACDRIRRVKAACKDRRDRLTVRAKLVSGLEEGAEVTLSLDDIRRQRAAVDARGRAKVAFRPAAPGGHEVCVAECPGWCAPAVCRD